MDRKKKIDETQVDASTNRAPEPTGVEWLRQLLEEQKAAQAAAPAAPAAQAAVTPAASYAHNVLSGGAPAPAAGRTPSLDDYRQAAMAAGMRPLAVPGAGMANKEKTEGTVGGAEGAVMALGEDEGESSRVAMAKAEQERIRRQGDREASLMMDRVQRYLTQAQYMDGLSGSGLAESNRVDAYNQLLNRQAANSQQYAEAIRQIDMEEADRQSSAGSLYEDYGTALYNRAANLQGADGRISGEDLAGIEAYYQKALPNLSSYEKQRLEIVMDELRQMVRTPEQQKIYDYQMAATSAGAAMSEEPSKWARGKNFVVTAGNAKYEVQLGDEVTDEAVLSVAGDHVGGEVWMYRGNLYIVNGSQVFAVEGRSTNSAGYNKLKQIFG